MGCFGFSEHRIMVLDKRKQKEKKMEKKWYNDKGSFARGNCFVRECR